LTKVQTEIEMAQACRYVRLYEIHLWSEFFSRFKCMPVEALECSLPTH